MFVPHDILSSHSDYISVNLGRKACLNLASVLKSINPLNELDLSNNDLQDSEVDVLSAKLKRSWCKK